METRFVGEIDDMVKVAGEVNLLPNGKGISMSLPEGVSTVVYGETSSGKRYLETVLEMRDNFPVYGEVSLIEILTFARKAILDLPDSEWSKDLFLLAQKLEEALK